MDKKDYFFFNLKEIYTENYHLRINNHYRISLTSEGNTTIIDAELRKVIVNANLVTLKFKHLNGDELVNIKFDVFANETRNWEINNILSS